MIPRVVTGSLSQRGTIQTYTASPTPAGGLPKVWTDTATVWMRIEPISGKENLYGMQLEANITHKITMRYRPLIPEQRILYKGKAYNIRAILNDDSRDRKLIVMAEEGVAT
jgi:SPP1 family predicted phage head-tail adaptor